MRELTQPVDRAGGLTGARDIGTLGRMIVVRLTRNLALDYGRVVACACSRARRSPRGR